MPSATLFRKEAVKGWYFDERMRTGEDNDAFLRLSAKTPFLFVPDTSILRRETPGSQSKDITAEQLCNGIFSMERFCFHLGGDKYVSKLKMRSMLSHKYRRAGKISYDAGNRCAAIVFFEKGIRYYPLDWRLYIDLLKALLLSRENDKLPNWQMPEPLPIDITVSEKPDDD